MFRIIPILLIAALLSSNAFGEECTDKSSPAKKNMRALTNVIQANCGNPEIWKQYHYNGKAVKDCNTYMRLREAELARPANTDPNLLRGLP